MSHNYFGREYKADVKPKAKNKIKNFMKKKPETLSLEMRARNMRFDMFADFCCTLCGFKKVIDDGEVRRQNPCDEYYWVAFEILKTEHLNLIKICEEHDSIELLPYVSRGTS